VLILVGSATAALETSDEVILNADYSRFTDEDQKTIAVEGTLSINNTGDVDEKIKLSVSNLPSDYNSSDTSETTIEAKSTKEVKFTVNIPHEEGPDKKEIGVLKILNSAGSEIKSLKLFQISKQMLELDELEVKYTAKDDDSETDEFGNDKDEYSLDKDVKPGTKIELHFSLENLFDGSYDDDGELEDVTIEIESDDNDLFSEEFEEIYEIDNIDADRKETFSVDFIVNEEADEDNFELDITIKAEDGQKIDYKIKKKLNIELGRESDDVKLTKFEIKPEKITICDSEYTFDVEIKNLGTSSQRYAGISIYNKDLDINDNFANIKLDEFSDSDNSWSKTITHTISKDTKSKSYPLDIRTYVQKSEVMDIVQKQLVFLKCDKEESKTDTSGTTDKKDEVKKDTLKGITKNTSVDSKKSGTITNTITSNKEGSKANTEATKTSGSKISSAAIVKTVEDPYSKADIFVAILLVAIALTLIIIITFLMILLKP